MQGSKTKVYIVLIMCIAVTVSIYLVTRNATIPQKVETKVASVDALDYVPDNSTGTTSGAWVGVLGKINLNSTSTDAISDDTTLTSKLAKDIFARYLQVAKPGQNVTNDDVSNIVDSIINTKDYTDTKAAVYVIANLHVTAPSNKTTLKKYVDAGLKVFENLNHINTKEGVAKILNDSLDKQDEKNIAKLDPFIATFKKVLDGLLNMNVPSDLVKMHLDMVNSVSAVLEDIESMRVLFDDPIRGLNGSTKYPDDMDNLDASMKATSDYYHLKIQQ